MDTFEPVREVAAQLHNRVVAAGADPQRPSSLVEAAVGHLDLELVWLPVDDVALKGSRALFDEQSGTICCVDVASAEDRALLAAHEIGHACVHAASYKCAGDEIDPGRSTEAAPVGLQRVENYGIRERRELQANVFAREFLFPRPLARRLHLDDGLGAGAIADRLSLPKDL